MYYGGRVKITFVNAKAVNINVFFVCVKWEKEQQILLKVSLLGLKGVHDVSTVISSWKSAKSG